MTPSPPPSPQRGEGKGNGLLSLLGSKSFSEISPLYWRHQWIPKSRLFLYHRKWPPKNYPWKDPSESGSTIFSILFSPIFHPQGLHLEKNSFECHWPAQGQPLPAGRQAEPSARAARLSSVKSPAEDESPSSGVGSRRVDFMKTGLLKFSDQRIEKNEDI